MRAFPLPLILLVAACGSGSPTHETPPQNVVRPAPSAPPARAPSTVNAAQNVQEDVPDEDPGLAGLSSAQRRAYDLGYRDCSHGRYAPDNHLEAYRIGCGAAHDRIEGRPQG